MATRARPATAARPGRARAAVDVIDATDLETSFRYDTPDEAESMRAAGTFVYFGMNAGILVGTPACGP